MKIRLSLVILLLTSVACADKQISRSEPHLFYDPDGTMKLEVTADLKDFRICAVGPKFTFCTPWQHPKSRIVQIEQKIPKETPEDDYRLFYEDSKRSIDLHHGFRVEK
jgi:hypothetical protein